MQGMSEIRLRALSIKRSKEERSLDNMAKVGQGTDQGPDPEKGIDQDPEIEIQDPEIEIEDPDPDPEIETEAGKVVGEIIRVTPQRPRKLPR